MADGWCDPRGEGPTLRGPPPREALSLRRAADGSRRQQRPVRDNHLGRQSLCVTRRLPKVDMEDGGRPPAEAPDLLEVPAAVVDCARASYAEAVRAQAGRWDAARKGGATEPLLELGTRDGRPSGPPKDR